MKLNLNQLTSHLSKSLATIYLLSGDETLLVDEAKQTIITKANSVGFNEIIRIPIESAWESTLQMATNSQSLFSNKQVILLNIMDSKINATQSKALDHYVSNPDPNSLLIICLAKLDAKLAKSNWVKHIEAKHISIAIWPLTRDNLPPWIMQRAKKYQLTFSPMTAQWLADQVEGNLLAANQELEKLSLLNQHDFSDLETLAQTITDHGHFTVFDLVSSVFYGEQLRSLRILVQLLQEGVEPILILWAILRELRIAIEITNQQSQQSLSLLFQKHQVWQKRQPPLKAFIQRHSYERQLDFLAHGAYLDKMIKGVEPGNIRHDLQKYIADLML